MLIQVCLIESKVYYQRKNFSHAERVILFLKRHETICRSYCLIIFDLFFQVNLENIQADAYLVIFSIAHRDTFDVASDLLSELRVDLGSDRPIVLVGNKLDLVRKRKVNTEGKMRVMFSLNRFFYKVDCCSCMSSKLFATWNFLLSSFISSVCMFTDMLSSHSKTMNLSSNKRKYGIILNEYIHVGDVKLKERGERYPRGIQITGTCL